MTTVLLVVVLAGYVVVATMTWRRTAWVFADKTRLDPRQPFSNFEIVCGLVAGGLVASVWPVTLTVYAVHTLGLPYLGRRFLLPPLPVRLEQQAREAAEQERRIEELERQTRA